MFRSPTLYLATLLTSFSFSVMAQTATVSAVAEKTQSSIESAQPAVSDKIADVKEALPSSDAVATDEVAATEGEGANQAAKTMEVSEKSKVSLPEGSDIHPHVKPWQLNFSEPVTPVMERIVVLHDALTITITVITVFVMLLLFYVMYKFSEKRNPRASKTAHNTLLEIAWTAIPVLILVAIAIPSLRLHYYMDKAAEPDMVLKVTGYQWYWNYIYPDQDELSFDSYMIKDEDLKPGQPRLLAVDNPIVVPVNTTVAVQITGGDVIHSWAMPQFGVKTDAVPGRMNETWFKATKEGVYYGQCSEICGVGHGFMPIEIHVVSQAAFDGWVASAKQQYSSGAELKTRELLAQAKLNIPAESAAIDGADLEMTNLVEKVRNNNE